MNTSRHYRPSWRRSIALAAAATAAVLLPAAPAMASPVRHARPTPVVQAGYGGWHHLTRRPHALAAVSPKDTLVRHIQWRYWAHHAAYGRGWPATDCPSATHPGQILRIDVLLYRVRSHKGVRYFSRMKLSCHDTPPGQPAQHVTLAFQSGAQTGWVQTFPAALPQKADARTG
jgi:hypothetical protein